MHDVARAVLPRCRELSRHFSSSATTWSGARKESDAMNETSKRTATASKIPKFMNEDDEAKWWASAEGREFLKVAVCCGSLEEAQGLGPRVRPEPREQRADRAAVARAGSGQSSQDRRPQRDRLPDPAKDAGARRAATRGQTAIAGSVPVLPNGFTCTPGKSF